MIVVHLQHGFIDIYDQYDQWFFFSNLKTDISFFGHRMHQRTTEELNSQIHHYYNKFSKKLSIFIGTYFSKYFTKMQWNVIQMICGKKIHVNVNQHLFQICVRKKITK